MSKRKLGIGTVDTNKKFKNKEEAMRYAKNLQQFIRDLCKRKGWQASVFIGISRLKKGVSAINFDIGGKRGRPKKVVDIYDNVANGWYNGNYLTDWHLHIIVVSKPSYTARNAIKCYIDKNWKAIVNEHEIKEFNLKDLGKKEVYKKKCNIKMADYFIWQSEEVRFCNCNYSGEEELKYSLKDYYYGYLKMNSAKRRLIRENMEKPMGEEKYLKKLNKIESKFLDIFNYFWEFSKEDNEKMQKEFMKQAQLMKIAENYEEIENNNYVQNINRRELVEDSSF